MRISRDFFKHGTPNSSNCLPIPYQERTPPVGHGHCSVFEQTAPLALSLVRCIRFFFHPSGHKLNSKDFFLIPRNSSNFSKLIISFRTTSPACLTIRPATCTIFHLNV